MIYALVTSGMTKYFLIVCFSVNVNAIKFLFDILFWALAKIFTTELLQQLQHAIFFYWRNNGASQKSQKSKMYDVQDVLCYSLRI